MLNRIVVTSCVALMLGGTSLAQSSSSSISVRCVNGQPCQVETNGEQCEVTRFGSGVSVSCSSSSSSGESSDTGRTPIEIIRPEVPQTDLNQDNNNDLRACLDSARELKQQVSEAQDSSERREALDLYRTERKRCLTLYRAERNKLRRFRTVIRKGL